MIDRGFVAGGGDIAHQFNYLLAMVIVLALGDRLPLLFRVDARREGDRRHPRRGARQSAAPRAALLRGEPAVGDRLAGDLRHGADRAGRRHHRLASLCATSCSASAGSSICLPGADADRMAAGRHPADHPADRPVRAPGPQGLAQQPGPDRRSRLDRCRNSRGDEDRSGVRPGRARERPFRRGEARLRHREAAHPTARDA